MDYTIIIVNGFDDLLCNDHKMVMGYEISSCSYGGDGFDDPQYHHHVTICVIQK